ncbi:phenylacetate--CoA ligase family protein [Candidatus Solincola sp.]|jgi:phenylacetate-coenzyme A ligase PaaK-like adenylate-forming protein|nr:AMP-binding protein [Actinomycetota bacterium]MDI7252438.1 AMP-binding protein [Actinomycetota bacterium]
MPKTFWDHLPPRQYLAAQEQHLVRFIRELVYPTSPYYRELFDYNRIKPQVIRTLRDLSCIPFTTKADIAPLPDDPEIPFNLVLRPDRERISSRVAVRWRHRMLRLTHGKGGYAKLMHHEFSPVHYHFTIGRTALPTPILYTPYDLQRLREAGRRIFELAGLDRRDMVINAFPFAPHLAFWMTYFAVEAMGMPALHTGGGRILGTERILDALERLRGTVLTATPSYAYHLLRLAAREGRDLSNLHTIILGGDGLPHGLKDKMLELLAKVGSERPAVISTYGFTEGRVAWSECRASALSREESSGYHLFPDMEYLEIVDPETGSRVEDGRDGEIVYTCIDWRGSVLLRFRTGDLVKGGIVHEPCPYCGRSLPRLGMEISRTSEYKEFELTKLKGTLVDLNAFYPLLSGHKDVLEWQLEIRKHNDDPYDLDELHLHIAPAEGISRKYLERELYELLQKEVEIAPTRIVFHSLPRLLQRLGLETKGREKRFLDMRPGAQGFRRTAEREPGESEESGGLQVPLDLEEDAEGTSDSEG